MAPLHRVVSGTLVYKKMVSLYAKGKSCWHLTRYLACRRAMLRLSPETSVLIIRNAGLRNSDILGDEDQRGLLPVIVSVG